MGGPPTAAGRAAAANAAVQANAAAGQNQENQAKGTGAFAPPASNPNANRNVDNSGKPILQGGTGKGTIILSGKQNAYGEKQTSPLLQPQNNAGMVGSKSSSSDSSGFSSSSPDKPISPDAVYTPVDVALGQAPRSWSDRESEYAKSLIINKGLKKDSKEYNQAISDYEKANNLQKGPSSVFIGITEGSGASKGGKPSNSWQVNIGESLGFEEGFGGSSTTGSKSGSASSIAVGLTDTKAQKDQQTIFESQGGSKNTKPLDQVITERINRQELGNAMISLSNKQIADKNLKSEKDLSGYFAKGEKQDAVFTFFSGGKQVGQTSSSRSFHDFLSAQKNNKDVSIQTTYPEKERALSESVKKNTDFFETLPQSYWDVASRSGSFSQNNVKQINDAFNWNSIHKENQNLAIAQGTQPAFEHGGVIQGKNGLIIIGPRENEASSFLRFPFSGDKTYNQILSGLGQKPSTGKSSTTLVPSTSFANVLQFAPGLPIIDKLAGPAGEVWINLISKGGSKLGELKLQTQARTNTKLQEKVLERQQFHIKEVEPASFEKPNLRNQEHIRPSNMFRKSLDLDILSKDTTISRKPVSARQNEPRNTMFEDVSKETQARNTKIQNDLLVSVKQKENPPASTNIPFFAGRKDQFGRLFTGNKSPVNTGSTRIQNEQANVQGKVSSASPISINTNPSESGLSPVSREFFGVQFKGTYPSSYLPPSSGFVGTRISKPVEFDIFYSPSKNIELGTGEPTSNFISESPKNLGPRKNLAKENQQIYFGRLQNDLLVSKTPIKETKSSDLFPEFTNPLGRKGKPAIQRSYPTENIMSRAEFVSSRKFSSEDFLTASGKKGSANVKSFGALKPIEKTSSIQILPEEANPLGRRGKSAIKSTSNELILSRAEVVEKTRPSYNNEVFSSKGQRLSKLFGETNAVGVLSRGTKVNAKTKTIDLEPQKNYQDWRFEQWSKKNPTPEPTGNPRIESFFKNLPSRNTKAAVVTNNMFNDKGVKAGFRRTGKTIYDSKPITKETKSSTITKQGEISNKGSKSETVLINKPLARRRLGTITETKSDYEYEFKPVPSSKSETSLMSGLKLGNFTGLKINQRVGNRQESGSRLKSGSILGSLNKTLEGTKVNQRTGTQPKLSTKLFGGQATKQESKLTSKQTTDLISKSKQTSKSTQAQKFTFVSPSRKTSNLTTTAKSFQTTGQTYKIPPQPPRKKPFDVPIFGSFTRGGKSRTKHGPTALVNLSVNNIFASSLSINVSKNRRYEF